MNEETRLMEELEQFEPAPLQIRYAAALAPRIAPDDAASPAPWGVVVPDLSGCTASGETQEEVMTNAIESVETWVEHARANGTEVPAPSSMDSLASRPDYAGWTWFFVGTARLTEVDQERVAEALAAVPEPLAPVTPATLPDTAVE